MMARTSARLTVLRQPLRGVDEVARIVARSVFRDLERREDLIDLAGHARADPVGLVLDAPGRDVGVVEFFDVAGGQRAVAGEARVDGRGQEPAVAATRI